MNQVKDFIFTPADKHDSHGSHFHDYTESFHGEAHHEPSQTKGQNILKELRKEFYSKEENPLSSKL